MTIQSRLALAGLFAGGMLSCIALSSPAQAIPFSATFTYGGGTNQTYTPNGPSTLLTDATSVHEGTDQVILTITSSSLILPGAVNDVLTYGNITLVIPPATSGPIGPMDITWGTGGRFNFDTTGGTYLRDHTNAALNFLWSGTFTDSLGFFDTQQAFVTQSWSQSDAGQRPSTGGVFSTLPNPPVVTAEPAGIAMFGLGLCALGMVVYRGRRHISV